LLDRRQARLDAVDGRLGIGAHALEYDTGNDLSHGARCPVGIPRGHGDRALADLRAEGDLGHIAHPHGHTVDILERDIAEIAQSVLVRTYPADAANGELLGPAIQIPAAGIAVVGPAPRGHRTADAWGLRAPGTGAPRRRRRAPR